MVWPFSKKSSGDGNLFYQQHVINRSYSASGVLPLRVAASLAAGLRISEGVAGLPISVGTLTLDGSGNKVRKEDHTSPIARLLSIAPNNYMTPGELIEHTTFHAVFEGVGRIYIDRGYGGRPKSLIPVNNSQVSVVQNTKTGDLNYTVNLPQYGGQLSGLYRRDFIEVTTPRWKDIEGLNVSREIADVLKLSQNLEQKQAEDSEKTGLRGFFTFDEGISKAAFSNVQAAMKGRLPDSAVLDSGADYKSVAPTPADLQVLETRRFIIEEVARAYGIHPLFLSHDAAGQSLTRLLDAMDYHVTLTLGPWVRRWEQAIRFALLEPGQYVDMDESAFYRMNMSDRALYTTQALGSGGGVPWETVNEARGGFKLNPVDGGDVMPRNEGAQNA